MSRKIFIHSIPRRTATGVSEWTNDSSGKKMQKTKMGRARDTIQALYSPKTGGLANGISYKPWKEDGEVKIDDKGRKLTLQDKLEQKWNLDPGTLTNRPWRKGDSLQEEKMTYFQRKSWTLNDGSTVLDMDNMDDELFYYAALDSKFIANSEREFREHKWPKALWYIALENEADEIKYKKNEVRSKAFAALHDSDMTPTMKIKFVRILGLASSTTPLTPEQTSNLLFDYIQNSTFYPGSNIDKFNDLFKKLKTPKGREELEARSLLKSLLDSRIIYEKQGAYTWPRAKGPITIGETLSESVDFILNPKKDSLVEELEKELKAKNS